MWSNVKYIRVDEHRVILDIESSKEKGKIYSTIYENDKNYGCTCKAFLYNKKCKHVWLAKKIRQMYEKELGVLVLWALESKIRAEFSKNGVTITIWKGKLQLI